MTPDNVPPAGGTPNPEFQKEFEKVLASYGEAVNADKPEEAERAALEAFMMASEEAIAHPTPDLLLAVEADDLLRAGDWARAEEAYRRLLAMQEQTGNFGLISKAQMDLTQLFYLIGRLDEAWEFACAATASARRMDVYLLTVRALENETFCALARNDNARALAAASEAVQVIPSEKIVEMMRAGALALRARCLSVCGDVNGAEEDLRCSWDILQNKKLPSFGTGPVLILARWWEAQAGVHANKGALAEAGEALQEAMRNRREALNRGCDPQSPHALAALARDLEKFAKIKKQAGDAQSAEEAMAEVRDIWEKLHLPGGPSGRGNQ